MENEKKNKSIKINKKILLDNCMLIDKIGEGSFGDVYLGKDKHGKKIAIKIEEREEDKKSRLYMEYKIYRKVRHDGFIDGIPEVYSFIETDDYNIMTMELLGDSLSSIHEKFNKKFDLGTVMKLGITIIDLIQKFHNTGFIHRDIKPNNFLIGTGNNKDKVYIMDLGLSKQYINSNGSHITLKTDRSLIGTARYTSVNIHMGLEPARRDELESIGYMLIYFLKGTLPWQGLKRDKKNDVIGEVKICTSLSKLCKDLPSCFIDYLTYCRALSFDDEPDYDKLRNLFIKSSNDKKIELKYCWV
jgi:serine/threonine protein kinase